jgi:AcrR family transcriptional regulator
MAVDSAEPLRRSIGARRNPATEAAILAAARDLLAERGYGGFSIDEVARRANAGKPSLYRWWPTKAHLFRAVYEADRAARLPDQETGSLKDELATLTRALFAVWRETPSGEALRGLLAEAQGSETSLLVLWRDFLPDWLKPVRALLGRAAARRDVEPGDIEMLLELYSGFLWRRLLTGQIDDDRPAIERMARLLTSGRGRK